MMCSRICNALALSAALLALGAADTHAQGFPSRPVTLVVPFAPGGTTDVLARAIGERLTGRLGKPVIIDNKPGAASMMGAEFVAKAPPDGHTLLLATAATLAINPSLYKKVRYDPIKSFAPVALVADTPVLLVTRPDVPAKNVSELIAYIKGSKTAPAFASAGNGTVHHLAGELFKRLAKVDLVHVPYKGAAPALMDVIGGQVPMMFVDLPAASAHVKAGKLRVLATSGPKRLSALPDVPTVAEAGLPGFSVTSWQAIVAPAGTPKDVVSLLNREINAVVKEAAMRERFAQLGSELQGDMSAEQFAQFINSERSRWATIIKASGATATE